jgi:excisionase family DNA binding protein
MPRARRSAASRSPGSLLRVTEVAALLTVRRGTVYRLLASGKLAYVRVAAGSLRVRRDVLNRYLAKHTSLPRRTAK